MTLEGFFKADVADIDNIPANELDEVVEGLGKLPRGHAYRRRFVHKIKTIGRRGAMAPVRNLTAKAEFEKRMGMLNDEIRKDILRGQLQIVDATIYGTRLIGGKSQVEIFENADVATVGLTNITKRELDKDRPFLAIGMIILSGTGADDTGSQAVVGATSFGIIPAVIANGEFTLEVGKQTLIDKFALNQFTGTPEENGLKGFLRFDNPKWIEPQREIKLEIDLPTDAAAHTYIKAILVGATVEKV